MKKISGFLDSSGKVETLSDEIVVVAASLATPFYWQEFAKEWKSYLMTNGCRDKNQRVLFHATQFHNRSYPYRETWGWDEDKRRVFYDGLIDLIKKRTEYSFATGVYLSDYRKFITDYPESKKYWVNPGLFASAMCFWKCRYWAESHRYDETISYVYDRNETFAKELKSQYDTLCENDETAKWWYFNPGGLIDGDKETYLPIQSVDVVAWEVARHYKEAKLNKDDEFNARLAYMKLNQINAEYKFYGYDDLTEFWRKYLQEGLSELKESQLKAGIIKNEAEFDEKSASDLFNDEFRKM